ncbi:hypothetical protein SH611_17170 [Geminicoccaceae bacterium 1502E]|nr:hypothetical protein [Geminicoccaceae bacterium 1502E]
MRSGRSLTRLVPALAVVLQAACAPAEVQLTQVLKEIGFTAPAALEPVDDQALFRQIGAEPTNARLHYENGRFLLARGRQSDLEIARVAFANASRLAPDLWRPELGRAAVEYRLGRYHAALEALVEAVERRDACEELCYGLAFMAYRAGYFGFAATALDAARQAGPPDDPAARQAAAFLAEALADGPGARRAAPLSERLRPPAAPERDPDDGNVLIDAYVIRQTRDGSSSSGINLLEALRLQFGATLVNFDHTRERGGPDSQTRQRTLEVSIPTVSYALNIASEDSTSFSIEASPRVVARTGQTSRFFEGSNVLIVPQGDDTESIERDIGIDLRVTPNEITPDHVDLTALLELSNMAAQSIQSVGGQVLQTDKTQAEATARIPFGQAMAVGSGATMLTRSGETGVPGLRKVGGVGELFGVDSASVTRSDVLVLVSVRRGAPTRVERPVDEAALSARLFGVAPALVERVSRLPSEAPSLDFLGWLQAGEGRA